MDWRFSVALCTYNGSAFLKEQIESILQQTILPAEIVISDDCSEDSTVEILESYRKNFPKIEFRILKNEHNVGVIKNFERCLQECSGDFIFLADQDDVWANDKIEQFNILITKNSIAPDEVFMAYSDLEVVDSTLQRLKTSFLNETHFQAESSDQNKFKELLLRNWIPGCASVISRKLLQIAVPFPQTVHMHDHWLALLALSYGRLLFLDSKLIKYRQHSNNEVGISLSFVKTYSKLTLQLVSGRKLKRLIEKSEQALAILERGKKSNLPLKWPWQEALINAICEGQAVQMLKILRKENLSRPSASLLGFVLLRGYYKDS